MKKKLVNAHEFQLLPEHMEKKSTLPSMTVPDESYTPRELLEKFSRNIDPGVTRRPTYDDGVNLDSPDLEKLRDSDLVDREEFRNSLTQEINSQKASLDATMARQQKAKADAAKEAAEDKALLRKLKASEKNKASDTDPKED